MASACNRFMNRSSVSSLRSAIRSSLHKSPIGTGSSPSASSAGFRIPSKPAASPRFSFSRSAHNQNQLDTLRYKFHESASISFFWWNCVRCPSELGCAQSLLPLHSTVAAARLTSCLSVTSRNSRALSQGTLCCTSPDLWYSFPAYFACELLPLSTFDPSFFVSFIVCNSLCRIICLCGLIS